MSSKRAKTDADHAEIARIEWYAGLYTDQGRICLPSELLEAAFINGARKSKLGKQAQAGVFVTHNAILAFDGSDLTVDQLWQRDANRFTTGVRIGGSRVMRTRPRFDEWSTTIEVIFDDELFNQAQIVDLTRVTGEIIGLGDWRPKFGRFALEVLV